MTPVPGDPPGAFALRMRPMKLRAVLRHGRSLLRMNVHYAEAPDYDWWLVAVDDLDGDETPVPLARRTGSGRLVPFVCGRETALAVMDRLSERDGRNWFVMKANQWLV